MDFLREFSIGINFVEITIELAIVFYVFQNYRKSGYTLKGSEYAAIGFLSIAITRMFYIIYDYYLLSSIYLYLAWVFLCIGMIFLIICLFMGGSRSIFRGFPYKMIYFLGLAIYMVIIITIVRPSMNNFGIYIGYLCIGLVLLIPLLLRINLWIDRTGGYIKRYFKMALIGLPLAFFAIGIGPLWTEFPIYYGWILKISAHLLFLGSIALLAVSLMRLPSLNKFDWEKTLSTLYVLIPNGACIYSFNFKYIKAVDPQLLTSGLTGIVMMVQEMTRSQKKLSFIKQEWKNLYVDYGNYITVALLGDEELKIIPEKIKKFIYEFERLFPDLKEWSFSSEEFKIANMLVRSIFSI